jgi:hypothetical protein
MHLVQIGRRPQPDRGAPSENTIHIAIELSVSSWLVAVWLPGAEKSRLHRIEGGDTKALLAFDAEGMLRVLATWLGGDRQAWSMVRVPTPEEEDTKRPHREREHLVQEKLRIENRIEALLFTQGIRGRPCLRSWERGRALPA